MEAEKFLRSYKQRGQTKNYSVPKKFSFGNDSLEKYKEVKKVEKVVSVKETDVDVDKVLIENVNTKEGLKAIVTELLKRRIENIKNQN